MSKRRIYLAFIILGALAAAFSAAFMFYNIKGSWGFAIPFRAGKLAALVLVGYAIAISTVLFQTITHNRILTPALMGFDQLYILLQTIIAFTAGALNFSAYIYPISRFTISAVLLILFASTLFHWLFAKKGKNLHLVLLVGIILGVLFRSLTSFLNRMIDPNAFAVLQDSYFANFNSYNSDLLIISAILIAIVTCIGWPMRRSFDILLLGKETAINLGLEYRHITAKTLFLIAVLVAVSTALVGPITFFGLLVANLAYQFAGTLRHAVILPMAVLIAIITLVGGQFILERIFQFNTALSIIIEFTGGILFLALLLKGKIR